MLLFFVFLFVAVVYQPQPVDALPFDGEYTNQEILAGNWFKVFDTMTTGDEITGYFETHSDTQGLDFFICDQENFDQWDAGNSATGFSIETDMHQTSIDEFTIPTAGVWYCVFVADGEVDTLTFSFGIDVDTSGAITTTNGELQTSPVMLGVIAAVFLIIILVCVVSRRRKGDTGQAPTVDHYTAPPSTPASSRTIREREITTRVLVVCPYCGAKNEQGILNCHNCDAEL